MNSKTGIFMHIALFEASIILAFGLSGYLTGLPLKDAASFIQMPINMRITIIYSAILYAIGLTLKQGMFLYLNNKTDKSSSASSFAEKFMIIASLLFFVGVYAINLLYYLSAKTMPFLRYLCLCSLPHPVLLWLLRADILNTAILYARKNLINMSTEKILKGS